MNWYAARSDDYTSPVVAGMSRTKPKARERVLSDDEIRGVWAAADGVPIFGDIIKVLLLTGARRAKVAEMKWTDVDLETGVWTIRAEAREKGNAGQLRLPEMALEVIRRQPRIYNNPYVFPARGKAGAVCGFNKRMSALRAKLPEDMPQWQLHDLRRTARSLLSRAGVRPDISERVLGHAIQGVEGVYDRHTYQDEKAEALNRLSALVTNILRGPEADNVIELAKRSATN
jgi:integrase